MKRCRRLAFPFSAVRGQPSNPDSRKPPDSPGGSLPRAAGLRGCGEGGACGYGWGRGPVPPPPSSARFRALPSLGSPPFRARVGGRSWARSIVERREEARGSRAEAPPPARLPPGLRGGTWRVPQPGCGERPGLAGSAAAPGTCALAQTSRDHEPDRPRLLLYAQLLCKCRPACVGPGPQCLLHPRPRPGPALEILNFSPSPFSRFLAGEGGYSFSFLDLL